MEAPPDAAVTAYAAGRGITEVLHFTTNRGGLGICATGAVKCRDELDTDQYLESIYTPNVRDRYKDSAWTGYVNLSISRVNFSMLGYSQRWHATEDLWWLVLALDPSLLADQGVHFVTTNNTYSDVLRRGTGAGGLRALFANSVEYGYYGCVNRRYAGMPDGWPTDPQAEVLYPGRVPVSLLRAVYVRQEEHVDTVAGWLACFPKVPVVPVRYSPEVFR